MGPSYADQRHDRRARLSVDVTLISPGCGPRHGLIRDISTRGAYVSLADSGSGLSAGQGVALRFHVRQKCHPGFSRQLTGRIVRVDDRGVALVFAPAGPVAAAAIEDLCFYAGLSRQPDAQGVVGAGLGSTG